MRYPELSDRECRIIRLLADGASWERVDREEGLSYHASYQTRARILRKLNLEDLTQVRLWASPISNREMDRLCGRTGLVKLEAVA